MTIEIIIITAGILAVAGVKAAQGKKLKPKKVAIKKD
jgi:hypothetical protein